MLSTEERQQIRNQLDMPRRFITTLSSFEGKEWPTPTLFAAVESLLADVEELHEDTDNQLRLDLLECQRRAYDLNQRREALIAQRDSLLQEVETLRTENKRMQEELAQEKRGRVAAEQKLAQTLQTISEPHYRRLAIVQRCDEAEDQLRQMTTERAQIGAALVKANEKKRRASKKIQELQSKLDGLHNSLREEREKTRDAVAEVFRVRDRVDALNIELSKQRSTTQEAVADAVRLRDLLDKELKKSKPVSNYEHEILRTKLENISKDLELAKRDYSGLDMAFDTLKATALELRAFSIRALSSYVPTIDLSFELTKLLEKTKWLLPADSQPDELPTTPEPKQDEHNEAWEQLVKLARVFNDLARENDYRLVLRLAELAEKHDLSVQGLKELILGNSSNKL